MKSAISKLRQPQVINLWPFAESRYRDPTPDAIKTIIGGVMSFRRSVGNRHVGRELELGHSRIF